MVSPTATCKFILIIVYYKKRIRNCITKGVTVISSSELAIVGDLGGTNCRVGVASPDKLLEYVIFPTPQDADELFSKLGEQILRFSNYDGIDTKLCALCIPGPISRTDSGVVNGIGVPGLEGPFSPAARLAEEHPALGNYDLLALNDAEASTIASAHFFAENDNRDPLLYLGIGTGLGSDISINYESLSHTTGLTMELAYTPIPQQDGSYEMLGSLVNGTSIREIYGQGVITAEELYKNPGTKFVWDSIGKDLASGIGITSPIFGFSKVVLGGGVGANCRGRIEEPLQEELARIFTIIPQEIVTIPKVDFISPNLAKTIGLQGCRLALRQRQNFGWAGNTQGNDTNAVEA